MTDRLTEIRELIAQGDFAGARRMALSLLDGQPDDELRARALHNLALATHRAGDNPEALRILTENADLFEHAPRLIKGNYQNELGNVLRSLGRMDEALASYRAALSCYMKEGRREREAGVLNNIALALKDAGRYREAFQHINEARRILESVNDGYVLTEVLDSHSTIIAAQAESRGKHHTEQPINERSIASEPQSTRAP